MEMCEHELYVRPLKAGVHLGMVPAGEVPPAGGVFMGGCHTQVCCLVYAGSSPHHTDLGIG